MAQCVIKRRGNHPHDHVRAAENIDREIETTEVLNANGGHPNIIRMIEHFIEDEYSHLVLEFCNQGDLLTVQQREPTGRFDHSRSLAYFRDVVLGLQYMHKHNLAHRDLSLENIFVTDGGRCKIGDFGLSVDATVPTHASVGKMMYMAPEVVDGLKYDPKAADIWSLGVMLFVMLTGVPLFDVASSKDKLFRAVTRQGLDPVLTICQKKGFLSPAVADLLEKLLALNPDDRLYVDEILEHDAMLMQ
ncbi:hypothetical protein DYB25_004854 [Aphanomyces astaci]|nr:hypothetical protein DYB36_003979 [Aphanomyces astaci]RHY11159.1 hypothetical protein DYB25_004854 [Aphanomyces astaci]RHY38661.1 hypothetical protein DYB30_014339 [Aphanomyces astaci]RHY42821.1 hypothetical protein DYB34_005613 [Aphanomyces astaci]RHY60449.1 hypothetical protein DYB38_005496 [Aphanomyces astaci]